MIFTDNRDAICDGRRWATWQIKFSTPGGNDRRYTPPKYGHGVQYLPVPTTSCGSFPFAPLPDPPTLSTSLSRRVTARRLPTSTPYLLLYRCSHALTAPQHVMHCSHLSSATAVRRSGMAMSARKSTLPRYPYPRRCLGFGLLILSLYPRS